MNDETTFRVATLGVILLSIPIAIYHRFKANSGERLSRREEGYLFAGVLRFIGLLTVVVLITYMVAPEALPWALVPLPAWVRWIGIGAGVCAAPLLYWTLSSLGKNLTDTVVTRKEATLITHGPYRWVRHPFYLVVALLISSISVSTTNWVIFALFLIAFILLAVRTRKEEEMLIERFGQDYRDYMAKTGRFFPRLFG